MVPYPPGGSYPRGLTCGSGYIQPVVLNVDAYGNIDANRNIDAIQWSLEQS